MFSFFVITCLILIGYFLNSYGVNGGEPLHIYSVADRTMDSYASLSNENVLTGIVLLILGVLAYRLLGTQTAGLSPVLHVLCSSLLILNILFTFFYLTHTGFSHYNESLEITSSIIFLQIGYLSLSFLYIAKLKDSLDYFLIMQEETEVEFTNRFILFLYRISSNYQRMPVLWALFLFPVLVIIQLIIILFGQRPDSIIRIFLETSSYNYSRIPAPKPEVIPGDAHYLCTVSVKGHKKLVKPVRAGIRSGSRIAVNRQLLIANAFEDILEEYTPNCHKVIRNFYNKYGYPLSKHINTSWSADIIYLLMKPFEWFFLFILYTVDQNPENRIHVQYSELRK